MVIQVNIFFLLVHKNMEFKSKQSKKKNLAFLKLYTIVQQYFSSM